MMKKGSTFIVFIVVTFLGFSVSAQERLLSYTANSGEIIYGLGSINDTAFSPDGNYLVTAGSQGVFLWDMRGSLEQPVRYFPFFAIQQSEDSSSFSFAPASEVEFDSNTTFSVLWTNKWFTRSITDGIPFGVGIGFDPVPAIDPAETGSGGVTSQVRQFGTTYSSDGSLYLDLKSVNLFLTDTATNEIIHTFEGVNYIDAAFNEADNQIVTVNSDYAVTFWDMDTLQPVHSFSLGELFGGDEYGVRLSPGVSLMAVYGVGPDNDELQVWDYKTGSIVREIFGYTAGQVLAMSLDGQWAFRSSGNRHELISLESVRVERVLQESVRNGVAAAFSTNGRKVAAVVAELFTPNIAVNVWDTETGTLLSSIDYSNESAGLGENRLYFSEDGERILIAQDRKAGLIDAVAGVILNTVELPYPNNYYPTPDLSEIIYIQESDGNDRIQFVDTMSGEVVKELGEGIITPASWVFVAPNGNIVAGVRKGTYYFDAENGTILSSVDNQVIPYNSGSVAFSADSRWMVHNTWKSSLFQLPSLELEMESLRYSNLNHYTAAIVPDEGKIYKGNADGTIVVEVFQASSGVKDWLQLK